MKLSSSAVHKACRTSSLYRQQVVKAKKGKGSFKREKKFSYD